MSKQWLQDHQTLKEHQQLDLNRILLVFAIVSFFFSSYIANYGTTVNEAWIRWKFIIYLDFTIAYYSLRSEVKKLITYFGYKIVIYLLINYFIDEYFGLKDWSLNDFITIAIIVLEFAYNKLKK